MTWINRSEGTFTCQANVFYRTRTIHSKEDDNHIYDLLYRSGALTLQLPRNTYKTLFKRIKFVLGFILFLLFSPSSTRDTLLGDNDELDESIDDDDDDDGDGGGGGGEPKKSKGKKKPKYLNSVSLLELVRSLCKNGFRGSANTCVVEQKTRYETVRKNCHSLSIADFCRASKSRPGLSVMFFFSIVL